MTLTLLTPTFKRDYDRFVLQRESIVRTGIALPHIAIVNTEDKPLFDAMPFQDNLTILTSEQVLGRTMDRRRQVWKISRKDYRYWITPSGIHGWMAQQLMKLAAARHITTDAYVCLDSDTFFVRPITASDFLAPDGKLQLYETDDDLDVEMAEWYAHSLRFLGVKDVGVSLRRFTHSPVPMCRAVVCDLLNHIEKLHNLPWMEALIRGERLTEYTTYGTYARHIDNLARVTPARPGLCHYFWWGTSAENIAETFENEIAASDKPLVLVNSNMGHPVSDYRALAQRIWTHAGVPA